MGSEKKYCKYMDASKVEVRNASSLIERTR
jgi:hypothetical protein